MAKQQYVEKPLKVLAEQYFAATVPEAAGVCHCTLSLPLQTTGGVPHAHVGPRVVFLHDTDWLLTSKYSGALTDAVTDAEFQERFGPSGGPAAE